MTTPEDDADFERRARLLLEESTTRVSGNVRSRLNQARHAALAQVSEPRSANWRNRAVVPAGLATAAVIALVAVVAWHQKTPLLADVAEDMELLADGETFELLEDDNSFYEWAVAEESGS
jgi:adenylylsulfate kinase-like enzyme